MTDHTIAYSWRLREVMATRGLYNISELIPMLTARGITLSASQIYRQIGTRPERMSLLLLGALTDALDCTVEDLCNFRVQSAFTAKGTGGHVVGRPPPGAHVQSNARPPRRRRYPVAPTAATGADPRESDATRTA
ncbi:helix-turn-helix domain-containing protein [Actinomadura fibrosa]|uniref:Helix-turn-helix domain-containing protein n=1 Tax=Actinomadura fibrosa TaxID=111802 RepID=A0ABW2XBL6_9ACTN|nr:helix-turn-helix transcriptional regulator [Actinomadura fibrosa]